MSNCLTQVRFLRSSSALNMITAATDGYVTLWNLTSVLEPFYSLSSSGTSDLSAKQPSQDLRVTSPAIISCENRYQMHSNSIKSLELSHVSDDVSVVLAGGDDNALTISLFRESSSSPEADRAESGVRATTVSVPDAHAASITATKLLRQWQTETESGSGSARTEILFASSGNDHRVKLWSLQVDPEQDGPEGITGVRMVLDQYSAVADISSLDVMTESEEESEGSTLRCMTLLVCGVGMEALKMTLA